MAITLASAMPPVTQFGSQAKSEIYHKFSFMTFPARLFFDEGEQTFTKDLLELFKTQLLVYTRQILQLSKGKKETKKNDLAAENKASKVDKKGEVSDCQPCSKELLIKLINAYFVDERKGAEYSKPIIYDVLFGGIPYRGVADHSIKDAVIRAFILVWEDKIDLSTNALQNKAVNQAALEVLGEVSRLTKAGFDTPVEYCGIVTNGTDWILVSYLCRSNRWRHSEMVSTVEEGCSDISENVIVEVARLLAYAFVCANSVLGIVNKATPFSHRLSSHEETDDGTDENYYKEPDDEEDEKEEDEKDEVDKISRSLETSSISKPTNNGAVGSRQKDGSGKRTNGGGSSGKGCSHSDFGIYQILTSELLLDKENIHPNKLSFGLNKAASTNFFFKN
jgi:hypothetical protein